MARPLYRLAIIGCGAMGEAILVGVLASGDLAASDVVVTNVDEGRLTYLADRYGVHAFRENIRALPADIVLFAVKPQVIEAVVAEAASVLEGTLVVSIAVGIPTARLEALLPDSVRIVRVMPNTPAMVGRGMSVVSAGSRAGDADVAAVEELFSSVGEVLVLDESLQDAAAAISGSGPAYFELIVDVLADAGAVHGLDREDAIRLANATMAGTAELIKASDKTPAELIKQVTSPGGTTLAALGAMGDAGIRDVFAAGVDAAVARARELAQD